MNRQSANQCTRGDCTRPAPDGQRCPECRGEPAAIEAGVEQSTAELLALLGAREQATLGRFG